ncbi:DEAD/DEAH box helicase family protein [Xanthomonas sacchari]|nr:DEAD/DEAH box helicase family protein [Xanthomonas sacchari]
MTKPFQDREPSVLGNANVREPQQEAFDALNQHATGGGEPREVGIILPVGCGKSGTITLTPFAYRAARALVIAPGVSIADQLAADFDPSNPKMFYIKCNVLDGGPYPEPVRVAGKTVNRADMDAADVVVTNVQQLQGEDNKWLTSLPEDYFDLIIFDEGHHSVAASWEAIKRKFPAAKVVNFSATPVRADGQIMAGDVIYSYSIFRAIKAGYVKRIKAVQLNPRTLKYVRVEDGVEIEVGLEEVKRLGEDDAGFRRSIVTSQETLNTIVDASLRELYRLREATGEGRLKIIASALNYDHCHQVVAAYRARGCRADFVHSREGQANAKVMRKLENHELDVIVQVRKLGEGFDHPHLAVAAVLSIFSNLSPFVQFVGRIMRVIKQNAPNDSINQGTVVFHAGANIARQWGDFQQFSEADQSYFDQLLPLEGLDPNSADAETQYEPRDGLPLPDVRSQSEVALEEMHLVTPDAAAAIELLKKQGIIEADFDPETQILKPVPTTKVAKRQAARQSLNERIQRATGVLLKRHQINPEGKQLDRKHVGRTNYVIVSAALSTRANAAVGRKAGERSEMSQADLDKIDAEFGAIMAAVEAEVINGA